MENNQQLVKQDEQAVIPASPSHLLELAISKDLDVEKLRELMQLQKEWQASRHVEQNSEEWDSIRAGRFTASRMSELISPGYRPMTPAELKARPKTGTGSKVTRIIADDVLADSAMTYIKEKVAETLTGMPKPDSYAYPLVWGKEMEPRAIEYFQEQTGMEVERVGFVSFGDHAGGSPDGLIGEDAILEVKCPYSIVTQVDYLMLTD